MTKPSFFNQDKLVEDLWKEINSFGLYERKGNEFYDYVLYLLNKYDKNHFLFENDNADNEQLLKIDAEKIKTSKKNISVKFMDVQEKNTIFLDFLKRLSAGKLPNLNNDGESYTMTIEDTALRSAIEARLKRAANTTLRYDENTELVTVSHEAFMAMLTAEMSGKAESGADDIRLLLEGVTNALKDKKTKQAVKRGIDRTIGALASAVPVPVPESLKELGVDALKEIAHFAYEKIVDRRKKEA